MKRVLVCGGRDYVDRENIFAVLDELQPDLVIHGGARGTDRHAGDWADIRGRPCMVFPAPWAGVGVAAGPIRNRWMVEFGAPTVVVAFPGGKGTADMKRVAARAKINVVEIDP